MTEPSWASKAPDGSWIVRVKAVPGSSRTRIVGPLGDALKIQVAAPPEAGAANRSLLDVLAASFGVSQRDVELVSGAANPRKSFRIRGGQIPS